MKKYKDVESEIVTRRECVLWECDMCGRKAEYPHGGGFEWGGAGISHGTLEWQFYIDGDLEDDSIDLCYECAEYLADMIRHQKLSRPNI